MNVQNFGYRESFNVCLDNDCFEVIYEKELDKVLFNQINQDSDSNLEPSDVGWVLVGLFNDRKKLFNYIFKNNLLDINEDTIFDIGMEFYGHERCEGIFFEDNPYAFWCTIRASIKPYNYFKLLKWLSEQDSKYFEVE